jgi:hypothetical protein
MSSSTFYNTVSSIIKVIFPKMSSIISIPLSSTISATISNFFPKFNLDFYPLFFTDINKINHNETIKLIKNINSELNLGAINEIQDIEKKINENILSEIYYRHKDQINPFIQICLNQKAYFFKNKVDVSQIDLHGDLIEQLKKMKLNDPNKSLIKQIQTQHKTKTQKYLKYKKKYLDLKSTLINS